MTLGINLILLPRDYLGLATISTDLSTDDAWFDRPDKNSESRRTLEPSWTDLTPGARLLPALLGLVRRPIDLERAGETLNQRLRSRDFLALARRTIYGVQTNPYRHLLATAGCEYDDLERLVADDGLESNAGTLARQGVYLTVEEFKGRQPVVQGSSRFVVRPASLAPQLVPRSNPRPSTRQT